MKHNYILNFNENDSIFLTNSSSSSEMTIIDNS